MTFKELAAVRQSCRAYNPDRAVSAEQIMLLVEIAATAPSACNSQPWKCVICTGETAEKIRPMTQDKPLPINRWVRNATAFIAVCETKARLFKGAPVGSQHYAQLDIGQFTAYLTLAAADAGLATCVIGHFHEKPLKALLGIPDKVPVRLLVAVGVAAENDPIREKSRKPLRDSVCVNRWE